jgi:hypothetical protein
LLYWDFSRRERERERERGGSGVKIWISGINKMVECCEIALLFMCSHTLGLDVKWTRKRMDSRERRPEPFW